MGLSVAYGSMAGMAEVAGELPEYAERVLAVVELIPPGRVMTYGDVAEWLEGESDDAGVVGSTGGLEGAGQATAAPGQGGDAVRVGPRQVGRVMALYGAAVPWWRVVRSDGRLLPGHEPRALRHYRAEGTPLRDTRGTGGRPVPRLDMRGARWDGTTGAGPGGGREPRGGGSMGAGGA